VLFESRKSWFRSPAPTPFHDAEAPRAPCRRSGDPPRFSWEGKLELTEVLRPLSQPRGNSRRFPPRRIRKGRFSGGGARASASCPHAPWHFLYFFPLPQGQGSL